MFHEFTGPFSFFVSGLRRAGPRWVPGVNPSRMRLQRRWENFQKGAHYGFVSARQAKWSRAKVNLDVYAKLISVDIWKEDDFTIRRDRRVATVFSYLYCCSIASFIYVLDKYSLQSLPSIWTRWKLSYKVICRWKAKRTFAFLTKIHTGIDKYKKCGHLVRTVTLRNDK